MWLKKDGRRLKYMRKCVWSCRRLNNLKIELSTKPDEVFFTVALEEQREQKGCSNETFLCVFPELTFAHRHFEGM